MQNNTSKITRNANCNEVLTIELCTIEHIVSVPY